jgi:phosphoglucomutase
MLRNEEEIKTEFELWKINTEGNSQLQEQLIAMEYNEKERTDAFYKNLEFGTGGLRGIMGVGTNRMNIYTISRATRGVAAYIMNHFPKEKQSVAISYDSRLNSKNFSERTAEIFASCGIRVFIYSELMPTPMLSWAVRKLKCSVGIMITASHNPAEYNGYKVYKHDGCQITNVLAKEIMEKIEDSYFFSDENMLTYESGLSIGRIKLIGEEVIDSFIDAVKGQSFLKDSSESEKSISIVYTPLNGTGLKPITRVLQESGYTNIFVVPEQKFPDGKFPTCPVPNPEEMEAMELGIEYAQKHQADVLLATDPDCDRVGVAVSNGKGSFARLSGNELGVLLLNYICKKKVENGTMPLEPVFMKSIVTTELAERIADHYGIRTINLLTGFKYIGEQIGVLEQNEKLENFIFGFEESCGYLSGTYIRDKDGVGATFLVCEMVAYYKRLGKTLYGVLEEIYGEFGYYLNKLHTYRFKGLEGEKRMRQVMDKIRGYCAESLIWDKSGEKKIKQLISEDYLLKRRYQDNIEANLVGDIPETDMIRIRMEDNCSIIVRPSGTESKIKIYVVVKSMNREEAEKLEEIITRDFNKNILKNKIS